MAWYLVRRLLQMIPVFLGAIFLVYFLMFATSGDPTAALCGEKGCTPGTKAALEAQYNLDKPFLIQFLLYLKGVVTLDLGDNFSGRPIMSVIADTFPTTIKLAALAVIFEAVFGILFGVIAGLRKGTWIDSTLLVVSLLVIAVPVFVLAFVAQYVIGIHFGLARPTVSGGAPLNELILPALVLGALSFAYVLRLTRNSIAENRESDHVRTATAKGLPRRRVITVHVLRNSLIPVVTFLGADLGALMGGAIVTESIFNVNGIGNQLYKAINLGDGAMVVSIVTLVVVIFLITNLVVDLLYAVLDPRIRYA
ncbi:MULTISPECIES: ABC transporter permease [Kocuria]|jgi:oligopeptide transport system permease protein|uniref:Dipeptide transport system permease protein DppB n=1 Tax=Kocuria palustris PEL TaxID=1236550 RepID=M2YCV1_9MICC|nr:MULTISPECIES: ABC transporter permease [Kocuria]EME36345.1 Dipeptide transport system permease protein DppB [Kocuria palustris PEL]KUG55093.1 ABC transporter permease [Kocuria palustris]MBM7823739.1 oligopeptide transport system permease protein [Kocuria palustris]MBN6752005.1 ABC transporter permease [Kocuria palustris]MBN6756960.1 ABC transporter permease [Kocuria palustris]